MGGTEAFPELGQHCQEPSCNQLDFLPFTCDGCRQVFCLEHRSYRAHECKKGNPNDRTVVICSECTMSFERRQGEEDSVILDRHLKSGACNPSNKLKPKCPVRRCKQIMTYSNTSTCKTCKQKVCLKHRFPADHNCKQKFLDALVARSGQGCAQEKSIGQLPDRSHRLIKS